MKNSHYVPQFILKKFSEKLCIFNVKTGELSENVRPEKAFMQKGFYSDEIEEKLSQRLESQFAKLLSDKILNCSDIIELSRKELKLIKKFLLISVIRSMGSEQFMKQEKHFYDNLVNVLNSLGAVLNEAERIAAHPFVEVDIPNETSFDYWMRTIDVILDTDGSPEEILNHPKKTHPAYRWSMVINAGYLAFWDSEYQRDEFVITDIGMTSENEKGWNGVTTHNIKKTNSLLNLFQTEENEIIKQEIGRQLNLLTYFYENFMMFPISAKRMIVLIAPFYKLYYTYNRLQQMHKLEDLTGLINEKLYLPNKTCYILPQTGIIPQYHEDDKYIYEIKKLTSEETRYCNALFLDRIDTTLGFSSLNKVIRSIMHYKALTAYPYTPRVDYKPLYKIISEYYQGNLS